MERIIKLKQSQETTWRRYSLGCYGRLPNSRPTQPAQVCRVEAVSAILWKCMFSAIKGDEGLQVKLSELIKEVGETFPSEVDYIAFSSWYNFGIYGIDFGWGKPIWASAVGSAKSMPVILNVAVPYGYTSGGRN
ncbi:hypothetical protein Patl1_09413 [Pistacia atlantica]|uniref:Uncharacterized protein n=1 Tax=Pistacia atlantica TaxID=434234 RepID=A0ACC1AHH1_9ROSI|nr:hypothetical protein Patl1_09413 [Pistacia atlantica]